MIEKVFVIPTGEWHYSSYSPQDADGRESAIVRIEQSVRNGEMALVPTVRIFRDGNLFCEVDYSQCVVYHK